MATGIYFHKQGREIFFIPYLPVWSVSFAVFLVLSWARKTCKHAPRASRQQEHTQGAVDANCIFRKAANAWLVPFSALTLRVFICMHLSQWSFKFFPCVFVCVWVLFVSVHVSYGKAVVVVLPWGCVVIEYVSERETSPWYWKNFIMWKMLNCVSITCGVFVLYWHLDRPNVEVRKPKPSGQQLTDSVSPVDCEVHQLIQSTTCLFIIVYLFVSLNFSIFVEGSLFRIQTYLWLDVILFSPTLGRCGKLILDPTDMNVFRLVTEPPGQSNAKPKDCHKVAGS